MPRRIPGPVDSAEQRFSTWLRLYHNAEMIRQAEVLPLQRDMVTLLTFVRDNKVVGTQSTGNMPLKAVRQVTARFVNPPELENTVGDHTCKLRSEADLWPLYFLHILAEVGGLLAIAPARRWRLTSRGKKEFLGADPLLQVSYLLTVWWYEVNWLLAYNFTGMGDRLPPRFNLVTLARLRNLPVETRISFEEFADGLIEETGLTWAVSGDFVTRLLRGSIARMVIYILKAFGAVECEHRDEPLGESTIKELAAFEITPLGRALLDGAAITSG